MSKHNSYDPEHERTCRGCHKVLKTKNGILEGKYKFSCSPCHSWYKKAQYWGWGTGIVIGLIIFWVCIWISYKRLKSYDDD